jgi:hypothetical protein
VTNPLIAWTNHAETGVLTAGSAEPERPAAALADPHGGSAWQSAGALATWIMVDAGVPVPWRAFLLARTNLTGNATVRWTLGSTPGGADVHDSTVLAADVAPGYGQSLHLLPAPLTARYARVTIADPANPDGFLRAGHLFAGPAAELAWSFERDGWEQGWVDEVRFVTSRGGQDYELDGPDPYRLIDLRFADLDEGEAFTVAHELDRLKGLRGNVLVVPRPDSVWRNREALYGRVVESTRVARAPGLRWAKRYRIKERP